MARSKKQEMSDMFSGMFTTTATEPKEQEVKTDQPATEPKKRGRKPKSAIAVTATEKQPPAKKRGRPKKTEQKPKSAYELAKEEKKKKKAEAMSGKRDTQRKSERKAAFSVWLDKTTAADLKQYVMISGEKMTDVLEEAIRDYLKCHTLTEEQKDAYKQREIKRLNSI